MGERHIDTIQGVIAAIKARQAPSSTAARTDYQCPECRDSGTRYWQRDGYDIVGRCDCQSSQRRFYYAECERAGIARRHASNSLARSSGPGAFVPATEEQRDAFTAAKSTLRALEEWLRTPEGERLSPPGLTLVGLNGSGKTTLATAIVCDLLRRKARAEKGFASVKISFVDVSAIVDDIKIAEDQGTADPLAWSYTADIAVLDDVTPPPNSAPKFISWYMDRIGSVISKRYRARRPTLITSNTPREDIRRLWGGSVGSRVHEITTVVDCTGPDARLTQNSVRALDLLRGSDA